MPNLLYKEESPYLRKHADNPINWYPWGEEALKKAKEEDKPILLSIGYSTCYWCSKMGREAFSDEAIAEFLNKNFIAIKVDREERPDIDTVYMEAASRLTENVGWPLNIFLTPEEKPFFAGTYFDVKSEDGKSDFLTVLKAINKSYGTNRKFIDESSNLVVEEMKREIKKERITEDALNNAIWYMKSSFDDVHGGFGQAPKFLISQQIFFMLRYWYLYREEYVLYMVEKTLDNIAKGEIYDSKRGGFFRYAVGSDWSSPHYEKMLYINALMAMAYLEAYQVIRKENYKKIVEETTAYIEKTLLSQEGGFYSAEDSENEKTQDEKKFIDEKISTGLNGIAIAAFAMCGKSFERKSYIEIAKKCVDFVFSNLYKNNESLNSYYIRGNSLKAGYASDYVYMIWGLIELYEATYQKEYLEKAEKLNKKLIDDFWDKKKAGIFLYSKDAEKLIINPKESYDGAIPSANSVCAMNFMRLSRLTGNYQLSEMGKSILEEFGEAVNKAPANYLYNLCAYFYSRTPKEIIVSANREEVLDKLNGEFRPFTLEVLETPENRDNI